MRTVDDLALYLYDGCGYCQRVRAAIADLELDIEERNIFDDPAHMRALVAARGRRTVPVLRIGEDRWMGESADIIAYLYERFGDGDKKPPSSRWPYLQIIMWGLLLGGGVAADPLQSVLWTAACAVAAGRSFSCAVRTKYWVHWAVGAAFSFGAVSIALAGLGVADLPWWYAAFAVAALVLGGTLFQRTRTRTSG